MDTMPTLYCISKLLFELLMIVLISGHINQVTANILIAVHTVTFKSKQNLSTLYYKIWSILMTVLCVEYVLIFLINCTIKYRIL